MDSSRQACSRTAPELSTSWDPAAFAGLVTRLASVAPCDSTIPPYRRLVIDSFYPSGCTYLLLLCPASTTTVMSTPASAITPFTVPWGRGTGRRAGVLLTVPPSSFSCGYCTATFAFASATASSTVLEERRLYQRIGAALLPEFHLRQRFLNCPVGRELRLRASTTDSLLCDTVCAGVAADG